MRLRGSRSLSADLGVPVVFTRGYGMSTQPEVAKSIWTDADFDAMGWHDNAVHAVALEPAPSDPGRLLLDIDYIVEWVPPEAPATTLSFWICPATLVFDRAWDLTTDIDLHGWSFQLFLNAIERSGPDEHGYFDWTLAGDHFTIALNARRLHAVSTARAYPQSPAIGCPSTREGDSAWSSGATPAELRRRNDAGGLVPGH